MMNGTYRTATGKLRHHAGQPEAGELRCRGGAISQTVAVLTEALRVLRDERVTTMRAEFAGEATRAQGHQVCAVRHQRYELPPGLPPTPRRNPVPLSAARGL